MANILDGMGLEGSFLMSRRLHQAAKGGSITRRLVASTIADMDLDPAALAEVEEAFIGAGLLTDR